MTSKTYGIKLDPNNPDDVTLIAWIETYRTTTEALRAALTYAAGLDVPPVPAGSVAVDLSPLVEAITAQTAALTSAIGRISVTVASGAVVAPPVEEEVVDEDGDEVLTMRDPLAARFANITNEFGNF